MRTVNGERGAADDQIGLREEHRAARGLDRVLRGLDAGWRREHHDHLGRSSRCPYTQHERREGAPQTIALHREPPPGIRDDNTVPQPGLARNGIVLRIGREAQRKRLLWHGSQLERGHN